MSIDNERMILEAIELLKVGIISPILTSASFSESVSDEELLNIKAHAAYQMEALEAAYQEEATA